MSSAARRAELVDIHRLNSWFGGYAVTLHAIATLARSRTNGTLIVADIGSGTGQFAKRIVQWAHRTHRKTLVLSVDRERESVTVRDGALAQNGHSRVEAIRADAAALPFRDGAIDILTTSLMLHHLDPDEATRALAEMRRSARIGTVVSDLLRSRLSVVLVWVATRFFATTPMARRDGPLSVRRAYSPDEVQELARSAGMTRIDIRQYPVLARLTAVLS